jgi:hypothetical protein
MNPIDVRFTFNGSLTNDDESMETSQYISELIGKNQDISTDKLNEMGSKDKSAILNKLKADFKNIIEFTKVETVRFNQKKENPFHWKMSFRLISDIFICIEILSDKTAACYNEDNKEVQFIDLKVLKMIVEKPRPSIAN